MSNFFWGGGIKKVNKTLNMLSVWYEDPQPENNAFVKHISRVDDYLWLAEDGNLFNGGKGK